MNNLVKNTLKPSIFLGLTTMLLVLIGLWGYDLAVGDANGIVGGIPIQPIIAGVFWVSAVYFILLALVKKLKFAQNALLALISVGVTFFVLEWFAGKWLAFQATNQPKIEGPKHSFQPDENLGYKPAPNETIAAKKTIDGRTIYDISFQTDDNSLRVVDVAARNATEFAQFYGCSMTFGEGVNSNETIPYYFAVADSSFRAYNFAFSGYGPTQMLARLQDGNLDNTVAEKSGFGVYIYIPDHINRVINTYTNYAYNRGNVPKYELLDGKLVRSGTYANDSKLRNFFFDFMAKSNILRVFNVGYPFQISDAHYELTAEVFAASAKEFQRKFQSNRFYIVIYPSSNTNNQQMIDLLRSKGLRVLDYSKLFDPAASGMAIPNDEHPTPKANQLLVKKLLEDIRELD